MALNTNKREGDKLHAEEWNELAQEVQGKQPRLNIVDALDSTSSVDVLSAKQGKILNNKIEDTKAIAQDVEAIVKTLPVGYFYGTFTTEEGLPSEISEKGYAYVGTAPDYVIYTYEPTIGWRATENKYSTPALETDLETKSQTKAPTTKAVQEGLESIDVTSARSSEDDNEFTKVQKYNASANINDRGADVAPVTGEVKAFGYKVLNPNHSFAEQVTAANTVYEIRDEFDLGQSYSIAVNDTLELGDKYNVSEAITLNSGDSIKILNTDGFIISEDMSEKLADKTYTASEQISVKIATIQAVTITLEVIRAYSCTATEQVTISGTTYYLGENSLALDAVQAIDLSSSDVVVNNTKIKILGTGYYFTEQSAATIYVGSTTQNEEISYTITSWEDVTLVKTITLLNEVVYKISNVITIPSKGLIWLKTANTIILNSTQDSILSNSYYYNITSSPANVYIGASNNFIENVDYILGGTVTIPTGSTLKFNGGRIVRGTLLFADNTIQIDSQLPYYKVIDNFEGVCNLTQGQVSNFIDNGLVPNDINQATLNGKKFVKLLQNNCTFVLGEKFYLEIPASTTIAYELNIQGGELILTNSIPLNIQNGFGLVLKNTKLSSENTYRLFNQSSYQYKITNFVIENTILSNIRFKLEWLNNLDPEEDEFGVDNFIIQDSSVSFPSYYNDAQFIVLNAAVFKNKFNAVNNSFINCKTALYIGQGTNSLNYKLSQYSVDFIISNNYVEPGIHYTTGYLAAFLIGTRKAVITNNTFRNIINANTKVNYYDVEGDTMDTMGSCYDIYASDTELVYENNTIFNLCHVGVKAKNIPYVGAAHTSIARSKAVGAYSYGGYTSKSINSNKWIWEDSYLQSLTSDDICVSMPVVSYPVISYSFSNNILTGNVVLYTGNIWATNVDFSNNYMKFKTIADSYPNAISRFTQNTKLFLSVKNNTFLADQQVLCRGPLIDIYGAISEDSIIEVTNNITNFICGYYSNNSGVKDGTFIFKDNLLQDVETINLQAKAFPLTDQERWFRTHYEELIGLYSSNIGTIQGGNNRILNSKTKLITLSSTDGSNSFFTIPIDKHNKLTFTREVFEPTSGKDSAYFYIDSSAPTIIIDTYNNKFIVLPVANSWASLTPLPLEVRRTTVVQLRFKQAAGYKSITNFDLESFESSKDKIIPYKTKGTLAEIPIYLNELNIGDKYLDTDNKEFLTWYGDVWKYDDGTVPNIIQTDKQYIIFDSSNTAQTIVVTLASGVTISNATVTGAWCSASVDGDEITITPTANSTSNYNTSTLTITTSDSKTKQISIVQTPDVILVEPSAYTFSAAGETKSFAVTTNSSTIASVTIPSSATWLTYSINDKSVSLVADANTGNQRTANVTIKDSDNKTVTLPIIQSKNQ